MARGSTVERLGVNQAMTISRPGCRRILLAEPASKRSGRGGHLEE
jgi:hypothetical protein